MSSKAILITDDNADSLAITYGVEDREEVIEPGYYLVAEFGVTEHFDTLTPEKLGEEYVVTGVDLENGYVEVEERRE